ncbi:hypothetical protein K438DRAFT_2001933 [Mycena galopus ATCC 62051]|nr:hypothetical protein K438DRAFT_2001933 [Mycena galopus ATCC 62051]
MSRLRLLDNVHVTGEDGAADLAARNATAKGAVALRDRVVKPSIAHDGDQRSLIHDDGGFPSSISVAVPERTRRSASDELAFSPSTSTRPTGHLRLPHAENRPSPQLLAAQEAWDRAFEALFRINPVTARAHLSDFSKPPATAKNSRRVLVEKEAGESIGARPDYGTDGGRDGSRDRKTTERAAPGPKIGAAVSAMSSCFSGEQMSVESALPLRKPAVAFAATTNESPSVRVHGDLCTWATETTEMVESRSACRKGAQRRETPVSHPNKFFISSLLCASGAQTTERAASASNCAVVSSSLSGSSDVPMLRPSALVHPKIEVASVATSRVSQPARDRGYRRTCAFEPIENVARVTSTPSVQRRLPEHAWVDLSGLESVVRLENRTTHHADKARRRAVTLDARVIEELPFNKAERRRDETQVVAAAAKERFAAAAMGDDSVVSPLADTPTAADIESERFGIEGGLKRQAAVPAYPDTGALLAHAENPCFRQKTIKMRHEPLRAGTGIVDDHLTSSVLQQPVNGCRSALRIDALCDSSEICEVPTDQKQYLEREAALDSRLPLHAHNNRACFRDGTPDRCLGEHAQTQCATSTLSTRAEIKSFRKVSKQLSLVPLYPYTADKATTVNINGSRWPLSGQETEQREAAAGPRALVAKRRKLFTEQPLDAALCVLNFGHSDK